MKKWIIILSAIMILGAASSGALAGHIYYKEMKTYEDYDKQELEMSGLENIYIDSAVKVSVQPTDGPAYVEFSQKFTSIIDKVPTYELQVESREQAAYITVKQTAELDLMIGIQENRTLCTLYLPRMALDKLSIKNLGNYNQGVGDLELDLRHNDIKELFIHTNRRQTIYIDGSYEKVDITQQGGRIEMHSKLPVDLKIAGSEECQLTGAYSKIKVQGIQQLLDISSELPAEVWIETGHGSVKLNGSYKQVDIKGHGYMDIGVKSNTLCQVSIDSGQGKVKLEGALQLVAVKLDGGDIELNTTVIPKRIDILGGSGSTRLMLPNNITGIDLTDNSRIYYEDNFPNEKKVISDYVLENTLASGNIRRYMYGDASTKIFVESNQYNDIYILNNGYVSHIVETQEAVQVQ